MIKTQYIPEAPDKYKGKQAIITSGRVLINAKDDSVLIFSKKAIALSSAGTLNFDSDKEVIVNAPQIQLGLNAEEPLLLGNKTVALLIPIFERLLFLADKISSYRAWIGDSQYDVAELNLPGNELKKQLEEALRDIKNITSKQNYTL